ncbi:unnamed protein product [Prorocentrum cordatum]|uniref:Transmembrane protein n=1 Tax=Prorocentrum cordatum TaxID=2364126 RepID=A0ABN9R4F6_9DINO|nr:unnamed protein product [Polarella glacialis]
MSFDEENFDISMIDTQEHRDTFATLYQYHLLVPSDGATRPWYYCIFIWYPYVANVIVVVLVLSAYFSFFLDPVHTWASSHLSVPSSTISEVLALHRDKSDPFTRSVWVACVIVLSSSLCFAFGPLRDIANISSRSFHWLVFGALNRGVSLYDVTPDQVATYCNRCTRMTQAMRQNVIVLMSMALVTFGIVSLPTSETTTCDTASSSEVSAQQMWHSIALRLLFLVSVCGGVYGVCHVVYSTSCAIDQDVFVLYLPALLTNLPVCLLELIGAVFFFLMMGQDRHLDEFCPTATTMNKTDLEYYVNWAAAQRSFAHEAEALSFLLFGRWVRSYGDLAVKLLLVTTSDFVQDLNFPDRTVLI